MKILRVVCLLVSAGSLPVYSGYAQSVTADPAKIVKSYFGEYNKHDLDAIAHYVSDDFKMYSVTPDTTTLDITGKDALHTWLRGYFKELPTVRSHIAGLNSSGNYVTFVETVRWGDHNSQSSVAVYEIVEQKIRRVWYYY